MMRHEPNAAATIDPEDLSPLIAEDDIETVFMEPEPRNVQWPSLADYSVLPMPEQSDTLPPDHVSLDLAGNPVTLQPEYISLHLEPPRSLRSRFGSLMPGD